MSLKTRTIAFSVAALLAGAGGIYAFMPNDPEAVSENGETIGSAQTEAKPDVTDAPGAAGGPSSEKASVQNGNVAVTQQPVALAKPAAQVPKKLTREQLIPPPASEDEKLQKAAQQESNF